MRHWNRYIGNETFGGKRPEYFGPLSHLRSHMLTFLQRPWPRSPGNLFLTRDAIVFCDPVDEALLQRSGHTPCPVEDGTPRDAFWRAFIAAWKASEFQRSSPDTNECLVAPSAYVQPGAVVGGSPYKVITLDGKRQLVPHAGGVLVDDDVSIGSNTCIDSGIYGEHTEIHAEAMIDNLVHIGHSVTVGRRARIVAGAAIGGWAEIGEDVWIGLGAVVRDHCKVGDGAVVGMGAVVVKDVPPGVTVVGNPAREMKR